MKIGLIGLGRMGANMARRLLRRGHQVVGFNRSRDIIDELSNEDGLIPVYDIDMLLNELQTPRVIWSMLPAGDATESTIERLSRSLTGGDILIDGANSYYRDTIRRAKKVEEAGIHYIDVGVSGGIWGLQEGYSMMIGGDAEVVSRIGPIFQTLAPDKNSGWGRVGPVGSGHFTKMIHNGIEYGMMEAYAEGFELLQGKKEFNLDIHQVSQIWQKGSVVRSWLLDLAEAALQDDAQLTDIQGWVADSGEGRWTVQEAIDQDVPAPVITLSLFRRFESRQSESFAAKLLAALRNQFGGHDVKKV